LSIPSIRPNETIPNPTYPLINKSLRKPKVPIGFNNAPSGGKFNPKLFKYEKRYAFK
jgi:hypothetical protein